MKEASLYKKIGQGITACQLCNHYCKLNKGQVGICGVRQNLNGQLYTLNYGKLITEAIDPIEKKPLYHFLPGSYSYSIATVGCNLRCDNCQNWQISQVADPRPRSAKRGGRKINLPGYLVTPEEVIKRTLANNCQSIAYTYTEPTIFFEFALACMKLAKANNLRNIWVSNGYLSVECLVELLPYLDAINVDLKFFDNNLYLKNCGCQLQPILDNLKYLFNHQIHLEITTLLIPGLTEINEQPQKIAEFIAKELSVEIPWHISRFSPEISYKMQNGKTTPETIIDRFYDLGKKAGLNYIYVGNVWGDNRQNTICPHCQKIIVERQGYSIELKNPSTKCLNCKTKLPLILF